jgi:hypothetical protein
MCFPVIPTTLEGTFGLGRVHAFSLMERCCQGAGCVSSTFNSPFQRENQAISARFQALSAVWLVHQVGSSSGLLDR